MRLLPLLLLMLACGSSRDLDTTGASDDATSGSDPGELQMRDRGPRPTSELGRLETTSTGSAVATGRPERESRPNIDTTHPESGSETELPLTPSEESRRRIFRRLRPDITLCLRGTHATFTVRLRVASSGIVREALVRGDHIEGTERAQCIEAAFRDTLFPAFSDPETTIRHDYRL